ncbi:MAG: thioredoxin family protein [Holophagaceae bacterium]|nr:thioredoxin family protein [Holophagaceae bacterium]
MSLLNLTYLDYITSETIMLQMLFLFGLFGSPQEAPVPQESIKYGLIQSEKGSLPLDSKDNLPVIIGQTTSNIILEHRREFRNAYEKVQISPELCSRWKKIAIPCTIVVVFGSWCGDSHNWVPDLIKLSEMPNPFISVHWVGTYRDKTTKQNHWPEQTEMQIVEKVPTFWLFTPAGGSGTKLVGKIVENPPKIDQTMAEALLELLESLR